jgi:hypothetical protein
MISPPPGPNNQHRHDLEITEGDRDLLWRLMRVGGSKAMPGDMQAFLAGIEMALGRYRQSKAEDHRRRSAREDLRDLFMACGDHKNAPKIRRKFPQLPVLAREELFRRAKVRHPDLNGGADLTWEGLCAWAQTCPDEELLDKLPGLIAAGRAQSYGQLRDDGYNSAPHAEPIIMGELLRRKPVGEPVAARKSAHKGGHPADKAVDDLVAELALLWLEATGKTPSSSRSKKPPFGQRVYLVLEKVGAGSPQNALRRYWAAVKRERSRPSNLPVA